MSVGAAVEAREREVLFRKLVEGMRSTTGATFALYRYPAKFIPQVIAYTLETYAHPGMTIFDPFAGYGTVGVVAKVYGHDYEMWDLNPLLESLHAVATMEPTEETNLLAKEGNALDLAHTMATSQSQFIPQWGNLSHWFPQEFLPLLFRAWGFYHSLADKQLKLLFLIPLLKTTHYFSYNDPQRQKLSRSPKADKRANSLLAQDWQDLFLQMMADNIRKLIKKLDEYQGLQPKPVKAIVKAGVDTLSLDLQEERDILITSPPYLQGQEYMRAAKMDLFWLGYSEDEVKELSKKEIPYRAVAPYPIYSDTYHLWRNRIQEPHLQRLFERYFWGVLGALTGLQEKIRSYLFLFVSPATIRGEPIPIHRILVEHFTALRWKHEVTLIDTIVSRTMFSAHTNPATGLKDERMRKEYLVILHRLDGKEE